MARPIRNARSRWSGPASCTRKEAGYATGLQVRKPLFPAPGRSSRLAHRQQQPAQRHLVDAAIDADPNPLRQVDLHHLPLKPARYPARMPHRPPDASRDLRTGWVHNAQLDKSRRPSGLSRAPGAALHADRQLHSRLLDIPCLAGNDGNLAAGHLNLRQQLRLLPRRPLPATP